MKPINWQEPCHRCGHVRTKEAPVVAYPDGDGWKMVCRRHDPCNDVAEVWRRMKAFQAYVERATANRRRGSRWLEFQRSIAGEHYIYRSEWPR